LTQNLVVIAGRSLDDAAVSGYVPLVQSALVRLVTLIAVFLMPLSMTAAPAVAHEPSMMGMAMGHCDEGTAKHQPKGGLGECTMACSAALPAVEEPRDEQPSFPPIPFQPALAQVLHGLHPDTATPPPKRS
jgi:hypothetical protein